MLILNKLEALERTNMGRRNVVEEVKIHVLDHLDGDLSREQVAYKTGFLSASQFSRVFRKSEGPTPNEYRRQQRNDAREECKHG